LARLENRKNVGGGLRRAGLLLTQEMVAMIESCSLDFDDKIIRARLGHRHLIDLQPAQLSIPNNLLYLSIASLRIINLPRLPLNLLHGNCFRHVGGGAFYLSD
jgi:hypothetical protein